MPRLLPVCVALALLALPVAAGKMPPPADGRADKAAMHAEIDAAMRDQASALAALEAEFRAATDETTALAIQREIADVKQRTELAVLGVQARHARQRGEVALAMRIESAIATLQAPAPNARPGASRSLPQAGVR